MSTLSCTSIAPLVQKPLTVYSRKCRGGHEKTKLAESPSGTVNWRGLQTNGKPSIADSRVVDDDSKNKARSDSGTQCRRVCLMHANDLVRGKTSNAEKQSTRRMAE